MPATLSDLKAEVARMAFLLEVMDSLDPAIVAINDPEGVVAQMRAITREAVATIQESVDEFSDWPDQVLQLAHENDWLRDMVEPVRRNRKTLEDWLGFSD